MRTHRPSSPESSSKISQNRSSILLWGRHVVSAVLNNPNRRIECLYLTHPESMSLPLGCPPIQKVTPDQLSKWLPEGAVHQGMAVRTSPLRTPEIEDLDAEKGMLLILDGVVDPHNVGALWRSAAVFGVQAMIVTKNNCPPLDGIAAKSACGASEIVPCISVTNLARTIELLQKKGFFCVGLAENGQSSLEKIDLWPIAFVVGSEGAGLRRLTRDQCDMLVSISCDSSFSTLNASVAGAIALHQGFLLGRCRMS
jgi:23S rRNA (guanosine2251-2'-O)-methyltransferase